MNGTVLKQVLHQPLSFRIEGRSYLRYAVLFFIYLITFLILFQPFFMRELAPMAMIRLALSISLFVLFLIPSIFFLFKSLFPSVLEEWNVLKETLWVLGHFVIIGSYNSVLVSQIEQLSHIQPLTIYLSSALVGLLPVIMDINLRYQSQKKKEITTKDNTPILYVRSDGNYLHVFSSSAEGVSREVQRSTLKQYQALHKERLVRVHKSFLVSSQAVREVKGNSNGGVITLPNELQIPYSRSFYQNVRSISA